MTTSKNETPVASWFDYDYFAEEQKALKCMTVILRTTGCYWRRCTMCGFWHESANVSQSDILAQLERSLRNRPDEEFILKLFTSGSFLDNREIASSTRRAIAVMVNKRQEIKKLIVETRPEFVNMDTLADLTGIEHLELAIGLETADEFIRAKYINKGFSFDDYRTAAKTVTECGATVKTYLLLKPPFVSEKRAIEDVIKSASLVTPYSSTISLNLSNVQKGTRLEYLWRNKYYRPPWLWSAMEAIKAIKKRGDVVVMSDPVGAGHVRGPHNCGSCDSEIKERIKKFNVSQDLSIFEGMECECKDVWQTLIRFDDALFGSEIV
ncbi:MAG: archaeosine biosynthesis radical SAM protein RaSEA [Halobacteriota archaeon]